MLLPLSVSAAFVLWCGLVMMLEFAGLAVSDGFMETRTPDSLHTNSFIYIYIPIYV